MYIDESLIYYMVFSKISVSSFLRLENETELFYQGKQHWDFSPSLALPTSSFWVRPWPDLTPPS